MDFDVLTDTITPTPGSTLTVSGGLLVTTGIQSSSTNSITAAGTNQGTATAVTTDYNVVTTTASGTGVILPAGTSGRVISIVNRGANTLNVYPASGGTIDALASNAPTTLVTNATLTLQAITATQWYIVSNSGSAGGVTTFSAGTTGFTPNSATAGAITLAGTLVVGNGGTGVTTTPTNGQLLIGNGTNYTVATLGSGTGISTTPGAGTLTINNTGVTSNVATANQTTVSGATGAVTIGLSSTLVAPGSLQVTTSMQTSATNSITAAGTTQGTGTVLTTDYNVVTTTASGTGVVLPAGLAGRNAIVVNRGANALLVYPASGAQIDALGANVAVSVIVNGTLEVTAISATQWYIVSNTVSGGGGAVSSVSGTANQVTASPTTGAVVVSLPSTIIAPGTVQATGSFIAGTATASVTSTLGTAIALVPGAAATTTSTGNAVSITGGPGGSTSGQGGNVNIAGGVPAAGTGGTVFISGANGIGTNQTGGNVTINAGSQTGTGVAGNVTITGGQMIAAGFPGVVSITGGNGFGAVSGGTVIIEGGNGGVGGSTAAGGTVSIQGGVGGATSGAGGQVTIAGGVPTNGAGGQVQLSASSGVGTNQAGGVCNLFGGSATGSGIGGIVNNQAGGTVSGTGGVAYLTGGLGGTTGTGGDAVINGGTGGSSSGPAGRVFISGGTPVDGNGGDVTITGSAGVGTNRNGGDIFMTAGAATGSGIPGFIQMTSPSIILNGTNTGIQFTGITTEPAAPPAGTSRLYAKDIGGRMMPKWIGPSGLDVPLQAHIGFNKIAWWQAAGNSTTITAVGAGAFTATGTATTANVATTNILTYSRRVEYLVTPASTSAVAGWRNPTAMWSIGSAIAGQGGFYHISRWGPATGVATTTNRAFVGMTNSTAAPTDVEPSSITNMCGMGWDAADTNIQFMYRGAGAVTKVDLGASFPVPTADRTKLYEIVMFALPGTTQSLSYRVADLGTGATATGTITTNLPTTATFLTPRGWMSVGGTSSVIGIAMVSVYVETDY